MKYPLLKDYLLLLLVAAIWGTSFSMIKIGVSEIGPATLAAGRTFIAALALIIWLQFVRRTRLDLSAPALFSYAMIGFFGNALPYILIGWSEQTVDSSLAAVLMGIMPLFTVIMAHFFLEDEPFSSRSLTGIGLGFAGLMVLLGVSAWSGTADELLAQITVLAASLSYAGVTIFVRRRVTASGVEVATGALIAGSIFAFIIAATFENPGQANWNMRAVWPMIMLGLFPIHWPVYCTSGWFVIWARHDFLRSTILSRYLAALSAFSHGRTGRVANVDGAGVGIVGHFSRAWHAQGCASGSLGACRT